MDSMGSPTKANPRSRLRKSIAHVPFSATSGNQENANVGTPGDPTFVSLTTAGMKKSRSKSMGPGGLDALQEDSGNRQKPAAATQYKSILKPTVPLSPPKPIPPHNTLRYTSPARSAKKTSPGKSRQRKSSDINPSKTKMLFSANGESARNSAENAIQPELASPSRGQARIAIRTEEQQQQAAIQERERQNMIARKDARRKSLANRRVSFAPEATLHTWDVVEMPEDSTTSSASTNQTRRASGLTTSTSSPYYTPRSLVMGSDAIEPPSTPPKQAEEVQVAASPAHQRDLHQKKRRRSSGIPPMNFNNPDDFSSSPHSAGSSDEGDTGIVVTADEIDAESSDSDDPDLVADETVTGVDSENATRRTDDSSGSGSSSRLEEALHQAAQQAGTQGIEYDENGDITMDIADEEITTAFKPWVERDNQKLETRRETVAQQDRESFNPFLPAFQATADQSVEEDHDATMEFTKAVGTILLPQTQERGPAQASAERHDTLGLSVNKGSSSRLSISNSDMGDETMELTTAIGGIEQNHDLIPIDEAAIVSDEDGGLSMDFTAVVGGVLGPKPISSDRTLSTRERKGSEPDGNALSLNTPPLEPVQHGSVGTVSAKPTRSSSLRERIADDLFPLGGPKEQQVGEANVSESMGGSQTELPSGPAEIQVSATDGLGRVVKQTDKDAKDHEEPRLSITPKPQHRQATPMASKPTTPSKQLTPEVLHPITPGKTPPSKHVAMRTGSPKKLFKAEIKRITSSPDRATAEILGSSDFKSREPLKSSMGSRRTSASLLHKGGIGSPRVTQLLDRRNSINEFSAPFSPDRMLSKGVRFADPRLLEHEIERERLDDERRESGRYILQSEANEQALPMQSDATANLKDKIQGLTPQKKKLKSRKSLHVGTAKGILGKRPAELDEEEDTDEMSPKHLKIMGGSPLKKANLPAPRSKETTSGRVIISARLSLAETSMNVRPSTLLESASPSMEDPVATSQKHSYFKDTGREPTSAAKAPVLRKGVVAPAAASVEITESDDRIQLQDFLNLTSIRFMELTTTKRRHTVVPKSLADLRSKADSGEESPTQEEPGREFENSVIAGACTIPMLDLYQHSCRELKKYIAEGRNIVREIEAETFEENPNLFREYMSAPKDVKAIMDNQFKNVKTHARLLSKAMWYEWRMKLLEGLKEGLLQNSRGMTEDDEKLTQQEHLIHITLPDWTREHDRLETDVHDLQVRVEELVSCDPDQLKDARSNLIQFENDVSARRKTIETMQSQLRQVESNTAHAIEMKAECAAELLEAERMQQECRSWDDSEIRNLEVNVQALEREFGWSIASAIDGTLTMTYKRVLQLYFTPVAFKCSENSPNAAQPGNAPISLTYIKDGDDHHPQPLTTEKRFFLQIMRAQLQFLEQSRMTAKDLLGFISTTWGKACYIAEEAHVLGVHYLTEPTILSDETLAVNCDILLRNLKSKVAIAFEVKIDSGEDIAGVGVTVTPRARAVYGEVLNGKKMCDFMKQKLGECNGEAGSWLKIVGDLEQRLIARGKRS